MSSEISEGLYILNEMENPARTVSCAEALLQIKKDGGYVRIGTHHPLRHGCDTLFGLGLVSRTIAIRGGDSYHLKEEGKRIAEAVEKERTIEKIFIRALDARNRNVRIFKKEMPYFTELLDGGYFKEQDRNYILTPEGYKEALNMEEQRKFREDIERMNFF